MVMELNNLYIRWYRLTDGDGRTYERYTKGLNDIADTAVNNQKLAHAIYAS